MENKKSLGELAEEINQEHARFRQSFKATYRSALRAGDLLNEAKNATGHGNWTAWVEKYCEFSMRTAQVYMQIARNRETVEEIIKSAEPADFLSIAGVLRELASPRGEPAKFEVVSESKDVDPEQTAGTTEFNLERAVQPSPEPRAYNLQMPGRDQTAELDERTAEPDEQAAAELDDVMEYVLRVIDLVENDERIDRANVKLVGRLKWLRHLLNELAL